MDGYRQRPEMNHPLQWKQPLSAAEAKHPTTTTTTTTRIMGELQAADGAITSQRIGTEALLVNAAINLPVA
jgi:hypothetical protein